MLMAIELMMFQMAFPSKYVSKIIYHQRSLAILQSFFFYHGLHFKVVSCPFASIIHFFGGSYYNCFLILNFGTLGISQLVSVALP